MHERNRLKSFMIFSIRLYKRWLSPLLPPACRFEPTCSVYALECLRLHPTGRAIGLILRRLARCQPFCAGGHDPVPTPK
ncbi:MAG: membrane protein insertion efficiency factor YidD [Deltaproteobacteria bacterium]|nr:membrane protein insertion efficiency factor YidD [Deltaproteobacteria bacterium]